MRDFSKPLLSVQDLSVRFGGIVALNKASFEVAAGSITALIGPNGAGKTTVFNCITGFYKPQQGRIQLHAEGQVIDLADKLGKRLQLRDLGKPTQLPSLIYHAFFGGTHLVTRAGIARTFQNIRLFKEMTVLENLLVAQHLQLNRSLVSGLLQLPSFRHSESAALQTAQEWLERVGLQKSANLLAGSLPYGHQRRLEIARAMCTGPRLICLDEPAAGLNPSETKALAELIAKLRSEHGVAVVIIEHDMSLVMDISDHVVVLNYGEVIAADTPSRIQTNPKVLAAYLGSEYTA